VDEVDRVEDAEIHALAQLVRSIADFPNVSYLLAYDATRVAEALGNGSAERGRSYLEKIIQLQIPVPILEADEMVAVLRADLERITDFTLPQGFTSLERYQKLEKRLVIHVLTTLRDVKRLIGTFRAVYALVQGEGDWIDVLGYSAVLTKAPMTAETLKSWVDTVTDDTVPRELGRDRRGWFRPDQALDALCAKSEDTPGLRSLLRALFPRMRGEDRNLDDYPEPLSSRYTLNAVLRLGAVTEQTWSRADLVALSHKEPQAIARELRSLEKRGRVIRFLERLRDLYPDLQGFEQAGFWQGASLALQPEPPAFDKHYPGKLKLVDAYADILLRWCGKPEWRHICASAFETLMACGDITLVSQLLLQHVAKHGLDGQDPRGNKIWFLTAHQTKEAIARCAPAWRALHLEGQLVPRLWEPSALCIIDQAGSWDDECVKLLTETVRTSVAAFDALLVLLMGPDGGSQGKIFTHKQTMQALVTERYVLTRTDKRPGDRAALEAAFKEAMSNARGGIIGALLNPPPTAAWTDVVPATEGN